MKSYGSLQTTLNDAHISKIDKGRRKLVGQFAFFGTSLCLHKCIRTGCLACRFRVMSYCYWLSTLGKLCSL